MKLTAASFIVTIITACAGVSHAPEGPVGLDKSGVERAIASSVRISAYCNGELAGFGSGTAVSPSHVLTARHVVHICDESPTPDMATFVVLFPDGSKFPMMADVEASNAEVDTARLIIDGFNQFPTWTVIRMDAPTVGDDLFMYTSDGTGVYDEDGHPFQFKRASVSEVSSKILTVSIHCVPGNSGGGFYDKYGQLVGILWGGSWAANKENFCEAYRPDAWAELIPTVSGWGPE